MYLLCPRASVAPVEPENNLTKKYDNKCLTCSSAIVDSASAVPISLGEL